MYSHKLFSLICKLHKISFRNDCIYKCLKVCRNTATFLQFMLKINKCGQLPCAHKNHFLMLGHQDSPLAMINRLF